MAVRRMDGRAARDGSTEDGGDPVTKPVPRAALLQRTGLLAGVVRLLVLLAALSLTVLFAVALARVTLVPEPGARGLTHANFSPGSSLRLYLDRPAVREAAQQVGGNILLGAPFGVILPLLSRRAAGPVRVTALTVLTMTLVETAQAALVPGRAFDVDDVLLNTTGAVLLYLTLGRRITRALHRPPRTPGRDGGGWRAGRVRSRRGGGSGR